MDNITNDRITFGKNPGVIEIKTGKAADPRRIAEEFAEIVAAVAAAISRVRDLREELADKNLYDASIALDRAMESMDTVTIKK